MEIESGSGQIFGLFNQVSIDEGGDTLVIIDIIKMDKQGRIVPPPHMRETECVVVTADTDLPGYVKIAKCPEDDRNRFLAQSMHIRKIDQKGRIGIPVGFRRFFKEHPYLEVVCKENEVNYINLR